MYIICKAKYNNNLLGGEGNEFEVTKDGRGSCKLFATLSNEEFILFAFSHTESCRYSINMLN